MLEETNIIRCEFAIHAYQIHGHHQEQHNQIEQTTKDHNYLSHATIYQHKLHIQLSINDLCIDKAQVSPTSSNMKELVSITLLNKDRTSPPSYLHQHHHDMDL